MAGRNATEEHDSSKVYPSATETLEFDNISALAIQYGAHGGVIALSKCWVMGATSKPSSYTACTSAIASFKEDQSLSVFQDTVSFLKTRP